MGSLDIRKCICRQYICHYWHRRTYSFLSFLYLDENLAIMPTDVMLSPVVVIPQDQKTYAKELLTRLSKAREYMAAITRERTSTQAERVLRSRKKNNSIPFSSDSAQRSNRNCSQMTTPMDWLVSHCRTKCQMVTIIDWNTSILRTNSLIQCGQIDQS
jgi:hypothetical protein